MSDAAELNGARGGSPASGVCLVTGASGFIGGHIAARLVRDGYRVRALARASSDTSELSKLDVELVRGQLADRRSLELAVNGVSHVVHCAALVSDWASVQEIERTNVLGTRNLLDACAQASVKRLVHMSSTDVYGHPGGPVINEVHAPKRFANWYAQTKLQAEVEVGLTRALDTVILRPATVYGPGSKDVVGEIARALRARQMLLVDGGRAIAGLCYIENLVDAVVLTLNHARAPGEAFNVSDGLPITWRRFLDDLAIGLGASRPRLSLPYRPAFALGFALEHGYRLAHRASGLTLPALLSRQAVQVLGVDQDFATAKARELLGWEPRVSYDEGMRMTLEWLRGELGV